jgi:hypothetical protein
MTLEITLQYYKLLRTYYYFSYIYTLLYEARESDYRYVVESETRFPDPVTHLPNQFKLVALA